jgi:hypothetical protein
MSRAAWPGGGSAEIDHGEVMMSEDAKFALGY